jgi:hypothetical protein
MSIRKLAVCGLLGAILSLVSLSPGAAQTPPGSVVFSEIMWPGSDASSADEWIELYNRSATAVDVSGWTITRGDGEDEQVMVLIPAAVIEPGGAFLISNYGAEDARSHLAWTPDLVDAAVSLPNSRLQLRLYDADPASGQLVDEADDGSGAPLAGVGGDAKSSMVRVALDMIGSLPDAWSTALESDGWDSGAKELGTPGTVPGSGQARPESPTQISASSWARLKRSPR